MKHYEAEMLEHKSQSQNRDLWFAFLFCGFLQQSYSPFVIFDFYYHSI